MEFSEVIPDFFFENVEDQTMSSSDCDEGGEGARNSVDRDSQREALFTEAEGEGVEAESAVDRRVRSRTTEFGGSEFPDVVNEVAEAVSSLQPDKRSRGYCITVNNYSDVEYEQICQWCMSSSSGPKNEITYAIIGKEVGLEGTSHLQMYVYFKNAKSFSAVKKIDCIRRAHIENAKGNSNQNKVYCSKDGNFSEYGSIPSQGKRSDLDDVAEMISEGASVVEIAKSYPIQYIKFCKGITQLRYLNLTGRTKKTEVYWLYGPTGTGKSHKARELATAKGSWYYKDPTSKWWDGYEQQKVVIVDDYRRDFCTFATLLRLLDEYEMKVEFKGGYVDFNSDIIVITTPKSPRDTWENQTEEQLLQLLRRIDHVEFYPFRHVA